MARRSRKESAAAVSQTVEIKGYKTAIYVRLSYEDERKIEQESVENQIAFLKAFVEKKDDLLLTCCYVDRGVSGTKFDRPEFNKMISDMRAGQISCIVVKDLSRLGRNYLEAGDYIEKIFPFFGVRFIAVTDNYDSLTAEPSEDGLIVPLKNLINEAYAKDISRKIRSSIDNMYRDGIMVASSIAYGYLKDPDGDHQIMIDEVAAPVVKRIFEEYIGGKGVTAIARELNDEGISSPGERRFETGARKKRKYEKTLWLGRVVGYIITNPIYTGDLEMGKRKNDLCKGIKGREQPKEERFIVHDHHEAIISREVFEKAQEIHDTRGKRAAEVRKKSPTQKNKRESVISGVLYCGDCKRKMNIRRHTYRLKDGPTVYNSYICPRSASYGDEDPWKSINVDEAEDNVAELIRHHIKIFMDAVDKMRQINRKPQANDKRKEFLKRSDALEARKQKVMDILQSLYSDYSDGVFTEEEYKSVKKSYIEELSCIESEIDAVRSQEETWLAGYEGDPVMSSTFNKFMGFEKLTSEIVRAFISRIYCYADGRMEVHYSLGDELTAFLRLVEGRGLE